MTDKKPSCYATSELHDDIVNGARLIERSIFRFEKDITKKWTAVNRKELIPEITWKQWKVLVWRRVGISFHVNSNDVLQHYQMYILPVPETSQEPYPFLSGLSRSGFLPGTLQVSSLTMLVSRSEMLRLGAVKAYGCVIFVRTFISLEDRVCL